MDVAEAFFEYLVKAAKLALMQVATTVSFADGIAIAINSGDLCDSATMADRLESWGVGHGMECIREPYVTEVEDLKAIDIPDPFDRVGVRAERAVFFATSIRPASVPRRFLAVQNETKLITVCDDIRT